MIIRESKFNSIIEIGRKNCQFCETFSLVGILIDQIFCSIDVNSMNSLELV